ncbi:hypothetical protein [Paenibacillus radicis (ex Xue et al. 2023)]|uniref:Uncharacterized protein n=1 Tax=Paenibacillus radicis (ex Xue et al. 2023) TaxID=2972489 RepID=A0ABT1YPR4_9BACL|nr:hypothetical protein [Paenibacillus radicis (ex Xue et al. 2023)]MCR8635022.1 hypothetical protein [Paenibacillus radicis (ex Xue et al. 2023)]
MTRDEFEKSFQEISSSWELDDVVFSSQEKELIRQVCMKEITMEQYDTIMKQLTNMI